MKKKLLSLALVVVMAATAIVGTTLAYFTDTDAEKNTFTVGNVKIDLIESQYHRVNAGKGNAIGETEPIIGGYLWAADVDMQGNVENTPDKENYTWNGLFFSDEQIKADAETYKADGGYFVNESKNMVPGDNVRKNPYVINKGNNPAYIRVRALVPCSLFVILDNGLSYWNTTALEDGVVSEAVDSYNSAQNVMDWVDSGKADEFKVLHDGVEYYEFDFTYNKPLEAGEMTFWNVWGNISIDKYATSEDLAAVESFDVVFEADAIQSEGFADAAEAFAAFEQQSLRK